MKDSNKSLAALAQQLEGDLHYDQLYRSIYATDASVYQQEPLAVALPKHTKDIQKLIQYAQAEGCSLIPRAAGTSLAGQCVGTGIVVDCSRYMNQIIDFNEQEGWIKVQPGIIRDELNAFLAPYGLFFSPITSTANRAMIGGMVGNNSCGFNSIVYGSTREHVLAIEAVLSDASIVHFEAIDKATFSEKCQLDSLEGQIYQQIHQKLSQTSVQKNIEEHFPKASVTRRNTGYALDALLHSNVFQDTDKDFNFCQLLCGSEGTLAFSTAITLHLDPLPPAIDVVLAAHFQTVNESLRATQIAMQHPIAACELMDKIILDCTKDNPTQAKNRSFIQGDPQGVLLIECRADTEVQARKIAQAIIQDFESNNLGYAYPIVPPQQSKNVWALRSSGLGLLANIPGDKKAVACIEDTAVAIDDLPDYIEEFTEIMDDFGQKSVYYAHAGAGELHLRPLLNLKKTEDVQAFYDISKASAQLIKKYRGSLSGEHGDGRLRAPFIPLVLGEANYQVFKDIKSLWDRNNVFNPGKIVDAPAMHTDLRYQAPQNTPEFDTMLDFSSAGGMLRMAEKCNGSGDCRKLPLSGGAMCPSYQASRDEKTTTRARANVLRQFLSQESQPNPFDHQIIKEALDLCLSCKVCASECPSNVDMASMKAEFLHQYYKSHSLPLRSKLFAYNNEINQYSYPIRKLSKLFTSNKFIGGLIKKAVGIAPQRALPQLAKQSLRHWYQQQYRPKAKGQKVYLFCDAFTNFQDADLGIKAVQLLDRLGYHVCLVEHAESGRAAISKGLLERAQAFAQENVSIFSPLINEQNPLIGIEPSAILSFKDEYPRLLKGQAATKAKALAKNCLLIDEFLAQAFKKGEIKAEQFSEQAAKVLLHAHCHQKALASMESSVWALSIPANYNVEVIPSGCCGMAGSFGYEKEHYELSMQVGEMVLFPAVREATATTIIAAPGTSCRTQIKDGTGRKALHTVEVLWRALV